MTDAEKLRAHPDKHLQEIIDGLPGLSAASESTAAHVRELDDGSRLEVQSVNGAAVQFIVTPPKPAA